MLPSRAARTLRCLGPVSPKRNFYRCKCQLLSVLPEYENAS